VEPWVSERLDQARHGVLVTIRPDGSARPVPFTFARVADRLISAVDHKPKTTTRLARLTDIERDGRATVLVEHYDDDWSQLWWIRVAGRAGVCRDDDPFTSEAVAALVAKYAQYQRDPPVGPIYTVELDEVVAWRATLPRDMA
jgi:PPOX class probable F420-dependent enzyme